MIEGRNQHSPSEKSHEASPIRTDEAVAALANMSGNEHLFKMLDGGDEYEVLALPGDTLEAIKGNLHRLLKLAGEPLECSKAKADKAQIQREKIVMRAQTALKLLATENGGAA